MEWENYPYVSIMKASSGLTANIKFRYNHFGDGIERLLEEKLLSHPKKDCCTRSK
ncbi:MAG: hypothetical protein ACE5OP_11245 [Candidatus Glassbacteria bacterium]